jgi:ribosomal protein S18 acetylase RimI-like enzyme
MLEIHTLGANDAQIYRQIRLRSLRDHPEAFGSSEDDEKARPIEETAKRLGDSLPDNPTFGAFMDGELVGIAGLFRYNGSKTRHRAMLWGMYAAPESRGAGVGKALLQHCITYARAMPDLEEMVLAVTVGNEHARALYVNAGFEVYSREPRYIKHDGRYYDLEWMSLRF